MITRRIKISIVTGVLFILLVGLAHAAPFAEQIHFVQPDGTAIDLWGEGDEFYADFETMDGYTVVFDSARNAYCYARLSADENQLESTGQLVGKINPQTLGLPQHLRIRPTAMQQIARENFLRWDEVMGVTRKWSEKKAAMRATATSAAGEVVMAPPSFTTTGTKVGLTLLIDFDDDPATIPQAEIVKYCNADSYTNYGNNGSVKKYFLDNSKNLLTYSNVVTVYIRIPNSKHPKSWYNDITKGCGGQGRLLITDAIAIMKALPNYTTQILPLFNDVTVDSNNRVVMLNVFYAGGNGGRWRYGLWPHSSALSTILELSPGGKKLYLYQITNIGSTLKLGTFCHENGHLLCDFPDIYDYDEPRDSVGGAGNFCLMGYRASDINPPQICAYLKRAAGWANVTELSSLDTLTATLMSSGSGFNQFYRYTKPGVPTEYFLLENRQKTGRDASLPASGIAIWHIDELGDKDNQSLTTNATHANYEVTLEQADNLWHFQRNQNYGDANDLYRNGNSAAGYSNQFTDNSAPNSRWWDGSLSGAIFRDFSASSVSMTFQVGAVILPDVYEADDTSATAKEIDNGVTQTRNIHVAGNVDWAQFTIGPYGASNVLIETAGPSGDTEMWLYGPDNSTTQIAYNDDATLLSRWSVIRTNSLAAGKYYIKVTEYRNDGMIRSYTLRASWLNRPDSYEADDTPATAKEIDNGVTQTRNIHVAGNVDWAQFTIGPYGASNVLIETAGPSGDTEMWLYGPDNSTTQIAYNDDATLFSRWSVIRTNSLPAGKYYIKVTEYRNDGMIRSYTLRASWLNRPDSYEADDTPATAKEIDNGVTQTRNIHVAGNVDWAQFTIGPYGASNVLIETAGPSGDTEMWLYGPDNSTTQIAYNDDATLFSRWSVIRTNSLPAGKYYIKVTEYRNDGMIRSYTLRASWFNRPDSYEADDTPATAKEIDNGVTQTRNIHVAGNVDWAQFTIGPYGASNVLIETAGPSGDTEMWLYGPDNSTTLIAYNDDGNGRWSVIKTNSLPAGKYYIKVTEYRNDWMIRSYTLRASWFNRPDSYEADDTSATAKEIDNGVTQSRNIHVAGNVDWVQFTIGPYGASNVLIETAGPSGDTEMWLYGPDNATNQIAYNDDGNGHWSVIRTNSLPAGKYYIKVTEYRNDWMIRSYTLRASWFNRPDSYEADDTSATAKEIDNGVTQTRNIHVAGNVDWAQFTIGPYGASNVLIETAGPSGDTEMWLYGPDNSTTQIAYNDDGNGRWSVIRTNSLPAGKYYIKVTEYGNDWMIRSYTLRASWLNRPDSYEADDTPATAREIDNGQTQTRNIHVAGNVDWAQFTIGPYGASNVLIETAGPSGDTEMWLYGLDNSATLIAYNDDGNGLWSVIRTNSLPAGKYYIKVTEYRNDGMIRSYTLRASWLNRPDSYEADDTPATAKVITNGVTQIRNINVVSNADWAKFTIESNGASNVRIETGGPSGDTVMWLYGPNNEAIELAYNDDTSTTSRWSLITLPALGAGTYYIKVEDYRNDDVIPSYTLRASWVNGGISPDVYEADNTAATAKLIANGATQTRNIHLVGDEDWVKFTIGPLMGINVRIETGGAGNYDTKLWLYAPDGTTLIASNDDSSGLWSMVTVPALGPGTYYILVQDYANDGTIGSYTLRANWMQYGFITNQLVVPVDR